MPMFEYECRECGAVTEIAETLKGGRIPARRCGACGGRRMRRVMSSFAYHKQFSFEDLGLPPMKQGPPPPGMEGVKPPSEPLGPPPGGCPYHGDCDGGPDKDD